MRVIANSFLALSILISTQISPATASGAAGGASQLDQLEQKYLGQVFTAEPEDSRVQRLEKFVFGDAGTGDVNQRLANLVTASNGGSADNSDADNIIEDTSAFSSTTAPVSNASQPVPTAAPVDQYSDGSGQDGTTQNSLAQQADDGTTTDSTLQAGSDTTGGSSDPYPRIGVLEKAMLGQTYPQQDVTARLVQLETKAYGKTSDSAALSDRVDNLEKYADKKYHKEMVAQQDKQVYEEDARGREIEPGGQGGPMKSRVPGLVNMVSNALFGGGPGMMGSPMYGGGPGMGGLGFGGVHMRDRSEVAKQEALEAAGANESSPAARAAAKADDPLVNSPTPPPANAKMLVKVGWCEVKLLGHTFGGMHLPERLKQINDELNLKPGKSGLALMDDVGEMVKATASKTAGASSIGSIAQPVQ